MDSYRFIYLCFVNLPIGKRMLVTISLLFRNLSSVCYTFIIRLSALAPHSGVSDAADLIAYEISHAESVTTAAAAAAAQNNDSNLPPSRGLEFSKLPESYIIAQNQNGDIVKLQPMPDVARKSREPNDVETGLVPPPYHSPQTTAQILFSEEKIRKNFLRKVYSILMVQLMITFGFVCLGVYEKHVQSFIKENIAMLLVATTLTITMVIILACVTELRRKTPWNYICLFMTTLSFSYLLMCVASIYEPQYVMMIIGLTIVITVCLSVFAFQPWVDFTIMTGFVLVILLMFITFGVITLVVPHNIKTAHTAYLCLGVLLFAFFIVYDTQLMIGGEHKYQISPEEYIFAALNLYLDIIYMFLYLLRLGRK